VLHLPWNWASQMSIMVRALRSIGVEARGLALWGSPMADYSGFEVFHLPARRKHPMRGLLRTALWCLAFLRAVRWADLIHWHAGVPVLPGHLCLRYIAWLKKPRLVGFCGTDIRIPEVAARDNIYVKGAYERGEMKPGTRAGPLAAQAVFARCGFRPILRRFELLQYLDRQLFSSVFLLPQPVLL